MGASTVNSDHEPPSLRNALLTLTTLFHGLLGAFQPANTLKAADILTFYSENINIKQFYSSHLCPPRLIYLRSVLCIQFCKLTLRTELERLFRVSSAIVFYCILRKLICEDFVSLAHRIPGDREEEREVVLLVVTLSS